jgi:hypothetical protein
MILAPNEEFSGSDDNKFAPHGVTAEVPRPIASAEMSGYIQISFLSSLFDFEENRKSEYTQ